MQNEERNAKYWHGKYVKAVAERGELLAANERLMAALQKIDVIRNDIVGRQTVNWSAHIYPLVAALKAAGFPGVGYEQARAALTPRDPAAQGAEDADLYCAPGLSSRDLQTIAEKWLADWGSNAVRNCVSAMMAALAAQKFESGVGAESASSSGEDARLKGGIQHGAAASAIARTSDSPRPAPDSLPKGCHRAHPHAEPCFTHIFKGHCPDETQPHSRDARCQACMAPAPEAGKPTDGERREAELQEIVDELDYMERRWNDDQIMGVATRRRALAEWIQERIESALEDARAQREREGE